MLSSPRMTLKNLRDLGNFLGGYPDNQKSAVFEYIISKSFADILSLPFHTSQDDDRAKNKKVVWNGSLSPVSKAPPGAADCLVQAHGFNCLLEPTMKEGSGQWTLEGAQILRHTNQTITQLRWNRSRTYSILATTKIAQDTFYNFHTNQGGMKIVLLEVDAIIRILEISVLTVSMRSTELSCLMEELLDCLRKCPNLSAYRADINLCISSWKNRMLESEKLVFVGLKALKAMKDLKRSPPVGLGEVYSQMMKNTWVKHYLSLIEQTLDFQMIIDSLTKLGFAYCQPGIYETIVYPVVAEDIIYRGHRIHEQVREVGFR